jgi:RNA polymerase sigma-70 factor (ECF subfamily)
MVMQQSDPELIQQMQSQDSNAFELFFARYRALIYRHIVRIVRNQAVAEDLTQEVFLRVWTHAEQWDGRGNVRGWLYRIGTNLALNQLRSMRRRPQESLEMFTGEAHTADELSIPGWLIDASTPDPEAALEMMERRKLFRRLIETLPEEKREVFRLIYDARLELQAVAETLSISVGTVKSRLHYGKKRLAYKWKQMSSERKKQ